jgi:hypothetical protein
MAKAAKGKSKIKASDRHPTIPHLIKKRGSAAAEMYPYLRSGLAVLPGGSVVGKLLADATRGSTSPLGGTATPMPKGLRER